MLETLKVLLDLPLIRSVRVHYLIPIDLLSRNYRRQLPRVNSQVLHRPVSRLQVEVDAKCHPSLVTCLIGFAAATRSLVMERSGIFLYSSPPLTKIVIFPYHGSFSLSWSSISTLSVNLSWIPKIDVLITCAPQVRPPIITLII